MSRSKPEEKNANPARRWYQWEALKGCFSYYDKDTETRVEVEPPFTFVVLDVLATVTGYHEQIERGLYANEVKPRMLGKVPLQVRVFGTNELVADGLWRDIKKDLHGIGGKFAYSIYCLAQVDNEWCVCNVQLKASGVAAWMDFEGEVESVYHGAVTWEGETTEGKKGNVTYLKPTFLLTDLSEELGELAYGKDAELQKFFEHRYGEHAEPEVQPEADRSGRTDVREKNAELAATGEYEDPDIPF